MKIVLGLLAGSLILVTGCATTQRVAVQDQPAVCQFLGEACEGLKPGAKGEPDLRYVAPDAQVTQYDKAMVEAVGFFGSDTKKVPPKEQEALTTLFYKSLAEALAKRYEVVEEPGPGVMLVQVVILDAEAATPGARSISMAIPQARLLASGTSLITGKYPFSGGGQASLKVTDAVTGQLLGAAVDRRAGGGSIKTAAVWKWGDAQNAIKKWSEMISNGLYAYTSGERKP
jgi:hypothetical protein